MDEKNEKEKMNEEKEELLKERVFQRLYLKLGA